MKYVRQAILQVWLIYEYWIVSLRCMVSVRFDCFLSFLVVLLSPAGALCSVVLN